MRIGRLALGLAVLVAACSSSTTAPANAPEDHTVKKGGAYHAPGLNDPVANCTACHGADLTGGTQGEPSCFKCHGKKW
jgi:cytochrome c553